MAADREPSKKLGDYATIPQVASCLNLCKMTIHRMIKDKRLASVKIGRSRRIPWSAVERLLEECGE